ncbi:hypothetical protein PNEG_01270 [Pneumocystis murina B123]|uniref:DNA repair and recombination protein RAD54B n=1 Tax=Pneumocystis murina (strain B123) TaxID=1069680 RepID=M7PJC7_PNEMU|nr:hypothetical protein PNEG_01270 [Pneumocystis murina B123]EMR10564.1 hypothetical protein PNEG_01270 [Pneumocystis murina B123]
MSNSNFISPLLEKQLNANYQDKNYIKPCNNLSAVEKRVKIDQNNSINNCSNKTIRLKNKYNSSLKKPFINIENKDPEEKELISSSEEKHYNVLWRKQTTKKNKTWKGDGILSVSRNMYYLKDLEGNSLGNCRCNSASLLIGDQLIVGDKEVEINSILTKDYLCEKPSIQILKKQKISTSTYSVPIKKFKTPLLSSDGTRTFKLPLARHDPNEEGALVLPRPQIKNCEEKNIRIIDVVVDPMLSKHLRPHQREGVKFLYECVMKMREFEGQGAILADEMGLGKSLQIIALLWTLLKQNPYYGKEPIIKRALIVCPVTLINNWKREFRKWIGGSEKIGLFVVDSNINIKSFSVGNVYSIMIIGYERLRNVCDELKDANIDIVICDEGHRLKSASNKSAQAIKSLKTRRRIILSGTPIQNGRYNYFYRIYIKLSLYLSEFYVMVDFVNPGLLENYSTFKREFENPIIRSRQIGCMKKDEEKGRIRTEQLSSLTKMFVLRRTSKILNEYLPPTVEYIVFCKPTSLQVDIYRKLIDVSMLNLSSYNVDMTVHLQALTYLKKICNSPALLFQKRNDEFDMFYTNIKHKFSSDLSKKSGKLLVFDKFLEELKTTEEKVVIVSHYTQTLQILENILILKSLSYLRLDGQTANAKRQEYVDKFNTSDSSEIFAFLLSAKSGGYGLNLIGASRLVLFDIDWNPSLDIQAMARIRRDGQQKKTFVYRFLTSGMIDEKIYQRQITKQALSDTFIDSKITSKRDSFTQEELKSLFFYQDTSCQTHELLGCRCQGDGSNIKNINHGEMFDEKIDLGGWVKSSQILEPEAITPNYLKKKYLYSINEYSHIEISKNNDYYNIDDTVLQRILQENDEIDKGCISYIFEKIESV